MQPAVQTYIHVCGVFCVCYFCLSVLFLVTAYKVTCLLNLYFEVVLQEGRHLISCKVSLKHIGSLFVSVRLTEVVGFEYYVDITQYYNTSQSLNVFENRSQAGS